MCDLETSVAGGVPLWVVDAFADGAFTGNPAAVCLLERSGSMTGWPDAGWMQRVAEEMNLSETAFVLPPPDVEDRVADGADAFGLRWFTPKAEVELCGHATLASAHVLFHEFEGRARALGFALPGRRVAFETRYAGVLTCERFDDAVSMDFPAQRCEPVDAPAGLLSSLRVSASDVSAVNYGPFDFVVELRTPDAVVGLRPDFAALAAFDARGVAVTAAVPSDHPEAKHRFRGAGVVSRFFAPRLRIAEDPVTGSLHCVLATYWHNRIGKRFVAYQASERGGVLGVQLRGDRVLLNGRAVTTVRGRLA